MRKKLTIKLIINYTDVFTFDDLYKAITFCELYTQGSDSDVKIELTIKSEVVEDDPVYSENIKGVDGCHA